jgi:malate/lactate dehydrogenase
VPESILIIGSAGSVGHDMMYLIAAIPKPINVIGADINQEKGRYEISEALHIAHNLNNYPELCYQQLDLFDINATANFLKTHKPVVICNLASLGSWWVRRKLSPVDYAKVGPSGPWIPNHLTLVMKLMEAVKKSGIETRVVNGAYPDATNVILSKLGYDPTCGGGNMDLGLSRVRRIVAVKHKVPVKSVQIFGVGHHGAYYRARMGGPFYTRIIVDGENVSNQWPNKRITKLYREAGYGAVTQLSNNLVDQMRTASSFLKHVLAIYYDTKMVHTCVTGVEGLPGGYPARLSRQGAEIVLPGITRDEAIRINVEGGKIDGIREIKDDGTVVYCEENVKHMREVLGYECTELKPSESLERARELEMLLKKKIGIK